MAVFPSDSIRTKNWGTEILTDADLEAQLDLLHAYLTASLNSSTGHTHDGTSNQGPKLTVLGLVAATVAHNFAKGSDIASATTTDIGAMTGNYADVTGTTTITGLGTVQAGTQRVVRFTGALTLTHNGTSLLLPSAANITTAANDVAGFVSLGSGNWKCMWYQKYDGTPVVGATASTALSGSVIQVVNTQTGATASGSTALPSDDTIPQNTEGDEYMTLAITPNNASNKLRITVVIAGHADSAQNRCTVALFQDSTANALACAGAHISVTAGAYIPPVCFSHYMAAGTTSSTTFKVRAGVTAGTYYFNGDSAGREYGGVYASSITIEEIKA